MLSVATSSPFPSAIPDGESHRAAAPVTPRTQMHLKPVRPPWAECAWSLAHGTIEVITTRLDLDAAAVTEEAEYLREDERQRASRFHFPRDCARFIVARARLRQLLASLLNAQPASIHLRYGRRGKPELARQFAASGLKFNMSHCEDLAVYAFTSGSNVGIDVEAVRTLADADEIAARFFSRRENEAYLALDPRDRPLGFFNCWTRKEAFIKALGEGLYHPLDAFDVSLAPDEPAKILRVGGDTPGERCGWRLESFTPAPGFIGAVVTERVPRSAMTSRRRLDA